MADVKFSELTNLAASAVATDDIFAVVDTSATTSKKLTVANLLGQVPSGAPLHINDTTDSTSGVTGAISTDGGLGVTLKSFLNGQVTFGTTVIPNASGTVDLGSAAKEFGDLYLGADKAIKFLADQSVTLTSSSGALTLNSTNRLNFGDTGTYVHQSADGVLDLVADGEVELTGPIVDIDASTGLALDGANLNSNWLVNTTNQIRFHDTGQHISAPADGRLAVVSDGDIELTATDIKVGLAGQDANIQALTNAYDLTLKQFDGNEVARVFDGGKALPTYATLVQTATGGFGYRKSVISYTADSSSNVLQLTAALSGSVVLVDCNSYSGGIKLPACATAAEAGMHFEFYLTAANSGTTTFYIETAGADGNDEITGYLHNPAQTSAGADITVDTAGDKLTLIASTGLGAHISVTCMVGHGTTERWVAHAYVPTDHVPTIAD